MRPRWLFLAAAMLLLAPFAGALDVSREAVRASGTAIGSSVASTWPEINGSGVVVAILDSGVHEQHPSLQGAFLTGVDVSQQCPPSGVGLPDDRDVSCYKESNPEDGSGHGTEVAGVLLGRGDANGQLRGMAPGARLVDVKIGVDLTPSAIGLTRGMLWVLRYNEQHPPGDAGRIDVVSISAGGSTPSDDADIVDDLVSSGVVVVAAAGNCGSTQTTDTNPCSQRGPNTVMSPASAPGAIAVGATDDKGTAARSDDVVWSSSSRGPGAADNPKPDVVAPGVLIKSSFWSPVLGSSWREDNGTSLATPHVTGIVALMLHANPALTPAKVKEILHGTSTPLGAQVPSPDYGWGLVDAYAAVREAKLLVNRAPTPAWTSPAQPIAETSLTFDGNASSDPDGRIVAARWTFGDGGTATGLWAKHTFATGGDYTVILTVEDDVGVTAVLTRVVRVSAADPVAFINVQPPNGTTNTTFRFDASGSRVVGSATTWTWTFGDGGSSNLAVATKQFTEPGRYNVVLRVRDQAGRVAQTNVTVVVDPAPVQPALHATALPGGASWRVEANGSIVPGGLRAATVDWGDGAVTPTNLSAPLTHRYASDGDRTIRLTIVSQWGVWANLTRAIHVQADPPAVRIEMPERANASETVSLKGIVVSAERGPVAWTWDVGGVKVEGQNATHAFPQAGTFEVRLTMRDARGLNATDTRTITIAGPSGATTTTTVVTTTHATATTTQAPSTTSSTPAPPPATQPIPWGLAVALAALASAALLRRR